MFPYSLPAKFLEEASDDVWTASLQADRITPAITHVVWNETEHSVDDASEECTPESGFYLSPSCFVEPRLLVG